MSASFPTCGHSAESRLLEILLPSQGHALMFEAYFDESGTHAGSPVMCVAGYVIESDQRKRMQAEWDTILSRYSLPYFHMSECAHGAGVFRALSKPDRSEVCRSLIELIKLRVEIGIAVSVSESDYDTICPPAHRKIDAYSFCLQYCMQGVVAWANRYRLDSPVSYFFKSGHRNQAVADGLVKWFRYSKRLVTGLRYRSHTFVSGKKLVGISAADLLAWEFLAAHRNMATRRPVRLSFLSLTSLTHLMMDFGPEDLREYFDFISQNSHSDNPQPLPEKFRRFVSTRELQDGGIS